MCVLINYSIILHQSKRLVKKAGEKLIVWKVTISYRLIGLNRFVN